MMYSCSLFVLMNGPRAPPYLDRLFSSLHQPGHGRPGARAAAFGLRAPSSANAQGSPAPVPRAGPAAGSREEGQSSLSFTLSGLRCAKRDDGGGGRARHVSRGSCSIRRGLRGALVAFVFFGVGSRRRPRRMTKVYIQRTFRKPRKNQANEEKSDVRARRRGTSAPSPAGTARRQPAPAPWPPPAPRTTRGASARRSAAVSSPAGRR